MSEADKLKSEAAKLLESLSKATEALKAVQELKKSVDNDNEVFFNCKVTLQVWFIGQFNKQLQKYDWNNFRKGNGSEYVRNRVMLKAYTYFCYCRCIASSNPFPKETKYLLLPTPTPPLLIPLLNDFNPSLHPKKWNYNKSIQHYNH